MNSTDFSNLIESLKSVKNAEVREAVFHKDGVYRESIVYIAPYTITIQYIVLGNHQIPLKFEALMDGKSTPSRFNSIQHFLDTLGVTLLEEIPGDEETSKRLSFIYP
ncbi:MAG TPA: hypothetical protein VF941_23905 [Clostridia bacterium]